jgi:hypothetical protein
LTDGLEQVHFRTAQAVLAIPIDDTLPRRAAGKMKMVCSLVV